MDNTKQMAEILVKWRDRILHEAAREVDRLWLDKPINDFDSNDKAYEKALSKCLNNICSLMEDPSYYGRTKVKSE